MAGPQSLLERMTFRQLMNVSDPKRLVRSNTVRGPALDVEAYAGQTMYFFNFKSNPSTTGLRQKGFIKFYRPKNQGLTLDQVDCEVDCTCPDYRFRWAWTNKQRGSSRVGPSSVNKAFNQAPVKTNPEYKPGLCKHLLALRNYIYGVIGKFDSDREPISDKERRLIATASIDYAGRPVAREKILKSRDDARATAQPPKKAKEVLATLADIFPRAAKGKLGLKAYRQKLPAETATLDKGPIATVGQAFKRNESLVVKNMIDLNPSIKLLQEVEADIKAEEQPQAEAPQNSPDEQKSPDSEALDLLRSIKASLQTLVDIQKPVEEPEPEEKEEKEETAEEEPGLEAPPKEEEKLAPKA